MEHIDSENTSCINELFIVLTERPKASFSGRKRFILACRLEVHSSRLGNHISLESGGGWQGHRNDHVGIQEAERDTETQEACLACVTNSLKITTF